MSTISTGQKKTVLVRRGQRLTVTTAASSTAKVTRKNRSAGGADVSEDSMIASETNYYGGYPNDEIFEIEALTGSVTESVAEYESEDLTDIATLLGSLNQPASGSVELTVQRQGFFYRMDFVLDAAQIPVTDAAGSGSYGSLKLFDFAEKAVLALGGRQNYTAFAEGTALTGEAGDASFDIAVGSVAIAAAADGALATTDDDIIPEANITLSGGTGTGTSVGGTPVAMDGTTTAKDLNLNWSGTAATIDANSTIDVTGTITVLVADLGDD